MCDSFRCIFQNRSLVVYENLDYLNTGLSHQVGQNLLIFVLPIVQGNNSDCVESLLILRTPNRMMLELNFQLYVGIFALKPWHLVSKTYCLSHTLSHIPWSWISIVLNEFWIRLNVFWVRWSYLCDSAVAWDKWAKVILLKKTYVCQLISKLRYFSIPEIT